MGTEDFLEPPPPEQVIAGVLNELADQSPLDSQYPVTSLPPESEAPSPPRELP